jgi:hypothetical protein
MSYFRELPDLEYLSQSPDRRSSSDYIKVKNIFKRPKLREDIKNAITAFNYYQVEDGERPDQIAEKIYNDPSLDWVVLLTNNIISIKNDWPLDTQSFNNYLLDKYGSEEEIYATHHYETVESVDEYNRVVIPGGLIVDPLKSISFTTEALVDDYELPAFPAEGAQNVATVTLNQLIRVVGLTTETESLVNKINIDTSDYIVEQRDGNQVTVNITNTLNGWPSTWGGFLVIYGRSQNYNVDVEDYVGNVDIIIPDTLYEIVGEVRGGQIVPIFRFRDL